MFDIINIDLKRKEMMNMNKNFKYGIVDRLLNSVCKGTIVAILPDGMKLLEIQEINGRKTSGVASFNILYDSYQEAKSAALKGGVQ